MHREKDSLTITTIEGKFLSLKVFSKRSRWNSRVNMVIYGHTLAKFNIDNQKRCCGKWISGLNFLASFWGTWLLKFSGDIVIFQPWKVTYPPLHLFFNPPTGHIIFLKRHTSWASGWGVSLVGVSDDMTRPLSHDGFPWDWYIYLLFGTSRFWYVLW